MNHSNNTNSIKRPYSSSQDHPMMMMDDNNHNSPVVATMVRQVAATATRENTFMTTTMKMDAEDNNANNKNMTGTTGSTTSSITATYQRLPWYGEHKRAISTVKIAPDRICHRNRPNPTRSSSYNNTTTTNTNIYETMTASASADGICKLWNISLPYYYYDDNYISKSSSSPQRRLVRGIMRSNPYSTSTSTSSSEQHSNSTFTTSTTSPPICMTPYTTLSGSHTRGINDISWNPILPYLIATASDDKTVKIWDCVGGNTTTTTSTTSPNTSTPTTNTTGSMNSISTSHPTSTNTIVEPIVELVGHDHFVFCVDQYRHIVATGSFDETIKLWDLRTGYCISTLPAHSDPVTSVAFNRDGTMIVSGSHDGLIRFWDVMTGECLKTLYATNNPPVSSVTYAPNGKYILAGTLDNTLRLWPVTTTTTGTNSCTKTYRYNEQTSHPLPHWNVSGAGVGGTIMDPSASYFRNTKYSIASSFTYDGNILVGNETGNPILFDLQTGHVLQVLHQLPMTPSQQQSQQQTSNKASHKSNSKGTTGTSHDTMDHTTTTENVATSTNVQISSNNNSNSNEDPSSPNAKENHSRTTGSYNNAVLAVSAHDTQPLLCTGSMGTKRVEFWSLQPILRTGSDQSMDHDDNDDDKDDDHHHHYHKNDHATSLYHHHTDHSANMMVVDSNDPLLSRPLKQRKNKSTKSSKQRRSN